MKRWMVLWAACVAVSRVLAGWEMLTQTRLDPSRMTESLSTNYVEMAYPVTCFLPECDAFTIVYMMQLRSSAEYRAYLDSIEGKTWVCSTHYNVTTAPARSTVEGGAELEDEQPWDYETPLSLNGAGQFASANALPADIVYGSQTGTVLCVNIETDSDLTLTIGAEEFEIEAASGRQRFNVPLTTGSRSVSVAAAAATASVKLGWATMDWIEFFDGGSMPGFDLNGDMSEVFDLTGPNMPWYMVVARSKIEDFTLTNQIGIYTVTNENWNVAYSHEVDTDRFEKDARSRMCLSVPAGFQAYDAEHGGHLYNGVAVWGAKAQTGWLSDAEIRRIADLDFKELHRRGATFPGVSNDYWEQIQ